MTEQTHRCVVCGKAISWNFALCSDDEVIYGSKATEWPDWLRFLWADTLKERRSSRERYRHEIAFDDLGFIEGDV